MDKSEIVAEFKSRLCYVFGYDQKLKFVGGAKSRRLATGIKASLVPGDFLNFAIEDSVALDHERNRINCLGNCKRAIDSQVDHLIRGLGCFPLARKQGWNIPKKLEFISAIGIVAPRILHRLNQLRNRLEHEFAPPLKQQVEDALDVHTLFISYAELVRVPTLNWSLAGQLSVRYDYDEMVFRFFDRNPSDFPENEVLPLYSLAHGEEGFQDLYDFLTKVVPLMQSKGRLGEDL